MRSDFNLGGDQNCGHPERIPHAREKSKDPAKYLWVLQRDSSTSLGMTRSVKRTQALQTLAPHVSHPTGAKYAGSDYRAGQARDQLR